MHEWFEQQLVEAVLGLSRSGDRESGTTLEMLCGPRRASPHVVLPRCHNDYNTKRVLGSKLGPVRERAQAAG